MLCDLIPLAFIKRILEDVDMQSFIKLFGEPGKAVISELLISRNFNCNLFRLEGQHQLSAGVDKRLLIHDFA